MPSSQNLTKFDKFIDITANPCENRNEEEIAKDLGVSRHTLWEWKQEPEFYLKVWQRYQGFYLQGKLKEINKALIDGALSGNMKAIELVYKLAGRLDKIITEPPRENVLERLLKVYKVKQESENKESD